MHQKVFTKYPHLLVLLKLGAKGSFLVTKDFSVRCPTVTEKSSFFIYGARSSHSE